MFSRIFGIVIIAMFLAACSSAPDLDASAKALLGTVYIRNNEPTAQNNCIVTIDGSYRLLNQYLPASGVLEVESSTFTNSDSEYFDPITHKVSDVSIMCGKRFAYFEF